MSLLTIGLLALSLFIIIIVMLQAKGSGLSIVPGSTDFGKFERRGGELILHRITIGLVVLFIASSILAYLIA